MGKWLEELSEEHVLWIQEQHMFFVASAAARGRVNVSPKGHAREGTLAILGSKQLAYLDMTGSGNETFAHSQVDGRITIMFMAVSGPPKIMRFHGHSRCVLREHAPASLLAHFSEQFVQHKGFRAVVLVDVERISQSCGFSLPVYTFESQRTQLYETFEQKTPEEVEEYHIRKNTMSIDCLPGLGHRRFKPKNPTVALRLTDGSGKRTPGAKGGYYFGYRDGTPVEILWSWLRYPAPSFWGLLLGPRDLVMLGLGASAAVLLLQRNARTSTS